MPRVVCIGEILVEIMRKEKDKPHNVTGEYLGPYASGAPAIFIDTVARLGIDAGLIGVVGNDDFGKMTINRLKRDGVDIDHIRIAEGFTTGTAFVTYYSSGERGFIFHLRHSAAGQLRLQDVAESYISSAEVIHIMGSTLATSETSREACNKAAQVAKKAGRMVTFDPNLRPELLSVKEIRRICRPILHISDIILPSSSEALALTGVEEPVEAGRKLLDQGPRMSVIKLGERGSVVVTANEVISTPAFVVDELDPTGAGDVFDGAFIVGILERWAVPTVARFANAAAAIKVTRFGPMEGPASRHEVESFIRQEEKNKVTIPT